ncbi:hypothetical protein A2617_03350 [Candidatus Daviesbacteria bacterium RIFOXYD1_FULL_41_10]|uniref:Oxidized purine nucleoside triphosphate hydrolase n=1 Tax=Candidatus Daviesbacteria bacterium RIFOXYD1_FULL_41_10 TaxID=1797801 RepID=A0A1F5MYW3_9BACT|nr:MAG: hypothetical protein A2617_03350 [Candidatus Daviesbacteria bacterium RIFOXYD1_FULL_41_10]
MEEEKVLYQATLCFPIDGERVLLAFKTKKIGKDRWNGYGGGIKKGETPRGAAVRELKEESGLDVLQADLTKMAVVDFHNTTAKGENFICQVHVFVTPRWTGVPTGDEAMITPTWFEINNLPFEEMMPADRFWLPPVLDGKKIRAEVHYGPFQKELRQEVKINEVDSLPETV